MPTLEMILLTGVCTLGGLALLLAGILLALIGRQKREAELNSQHRAEEIKAWQATVAAQKAALAAQAAAERVAAADEPVPRYAGGDAVVLPAKTPPADPAREMALAVQAAMQNEVEAANKRPHQQYTGDTEVFSNEEGVVAIVGVTPRRSCVHGDGCEACPRPEPKPATGSVEIRHHKPLHTGEGVSPVPLPGRLPVSPRDKLGHYVTPVSKRAQSDVPAQAHDMDAAELLRRIAADKAYRSQVAQAATAEKALRLEQGRVNGELTDTAAIASILDPGTEFGPPKDAYAEAAADN